MSAGPTRALLHGAPPRARARPGGSNMARASNGRPGRFHGLGQGARTGSTTCLARRDILCFVLVTCLAHTRSSAYAPRRIPLRRGRAQAPAPLPSLRGGARFGREAESQTSPSPRAASQERPRATGHLHDEPHNHLLPPVIVPLRQQPPRAKPSQTRAPMPPRVDYKLLVSSAFPFFRSPESPGKHPWLGRRRRGHRCARE